MTPEQIQWLTWGAIQHRPPGAPKWDHPGTAKAIADHCGTWGLDIATQHVLAHARDPKARTPFAIKGNAPHTDATPGPRFPAKPDDECRLHRGEHADACRACAADKLAGDNEARTPPRPHQAAEPTAGYRAARAAVDRPATTEEETE